MPKLLYVAQCLEWCQGLVWPEGWEAVCVHTIDVLEEPLPALLVLDISGMETEQALGLLAAWQSQASTSQLPVLLLTPPLTEEALGQYLKMGVSDYVLLPLSGLTLGLRLQQLLATQQQLQTIQQQKLALAELHQTRERFLSILGHDLRSPLNSLHSFAYLISQHLDALSREELQQLGEDLTHAVKYLHKLLDSLREWAVAPQAAHTIPHNVVLQHLIEENIQLMRHLASQKTITVSNEVSEKHWVQADRNALRAIIRNLLSNALKFTPQGGEVVWSALPLSDTVLEVCIRDNGVGMNEEMLGQLFEPNHRFSTKGTAGEQGTGLGLILCRELIIQIGGEIRLESSPEQGMSVYFTLALAAPNPDTESLQP